MINNWEYLSEYKKYKPKILKLIDKILSSGTLLFGKELARFEKNFCLYNKAKYGLGIANGTDALFMALKSLNIGSGDEVITVSNTAIPTVAAIVSSGAIPRFVDIGDDYLIDPSKIPLAINKNTKAIIVVHLFGQVCDMPKIIKIAKKFKLRIIEDCAQSCGATLEGKKCGTWGDIGCFSFYPTKILGSYGDGGFIITKNKTLYKKIKSYRFYGIETENQNSRYFKKYYALSHGTNSRLSEVQAGILNFKLKKLNKFISERQKIAKLYISGLANTKFKLPQLKNNVFHIFPVLHNNRKSIFKNLKKKKINLNINYPFPIHKMKAYKKYVCKSCNCLEKTEKISKQIFSLPIYPNFSITNIDKIITYLKEA